MIAYKVTSKGRVYPTCILDSFGLFHTTLEEFKKTYGLQRLDLRDRTKYMRAVTSSRISLSKDKTRLKLACNPMTDDLAMIFSEWISQKPGFRAVRSAEIQSEVPIEVFEFPF